MWFLRRSCRLVGIVWVLAVLFVGGAVAVWGEQVAKRGVGDAVRICRAGETREAARIATWWGIPYVTRLAVVRREELVVF